MLKNICLVLLLALIAMPAGASEHVFPTLTAKDLNKREVTLPQGLPGDPSVVMLAFYRKQQDDLNTWINGMNLKAEDAPPWVELPVVGWHNRLFSRYIDNGMRSGITATEDRARTITIYRGRSWLLEPLGLSETDRVYVLVVRQNGEVLLTLEGTYSEEKATQVRAVFENAVAF
ncbi:MAG: hypothetical protein AAF603_02365 [Pseudomonadota bacterium]